MARAARALRHPGAKFSSKNHETLLLTIPLLAGMGAVGQTTATVSANLSDRYGIVVRVEEAASCGGQH
jgi:hypothetical protein